MSRGMRLLVALGALCAIVAAQQASARPSACKAGVIPFGGVQARVFCGPAKATAKVAGKTLKFSQGACEKSSTYFSINIGTVVLGIPNKPKPNYFGIVVGQSLATSGPPAGKDGTYKQGNVAIAYGGKGYSLRGGATITLKNGRSKGTFSGLTFDGKPVTGSFSC